MFKSLTDTTPANTYKGLLHAGGQELSLTGSSLIYDGNGSPSSMSLGVSGNGVTFSGTLSTQSLIVSDLSYPTTVGNIKDIVFQTDLAGTLQLGSLNTLFNLDESDISSTGTFYNIHSIQVKNGLIVNVSTIPRALTLFLDLETFNPNLLSAVGSTSDGSYGIYPYNQITSDTQNVRSIDPEVVRVFYLNNVWGGDTTIYGTPVVGDIATVIVGYSVPNLSSTISTNLSSDSVSNSFKLYGILYVREQTGWSWQKYLSLDRMGEWAGLPGTTPTLNTYRDSRVVTYGTSTDPANTTFRSVIALTAYDGGSFVEKVVSFYDNSYNP